MLILSFEANSALSRENETKIVKITHSAVVSRPLIRTDLEVNNFAQDTLNDMTQWAT